MAIADETGIIHCRASRPVILLGWRADQVSAPAAVVRSCCAHFKLSAPNGTSIVGDWRCLKMGLCVDGYRAVRSHICQRGGGQWDGDCSG
jgi:hypothetical protein